MNQFEIETNKEFSVMNPNDFKFKKGFPYSVIVCKENSLYFKTTYCMNEAEEDKLTEEFTKMGFEYIIYR